MYSRLHISLHTRRDASQYMHVCNTTIELLTYLHTHDNLDTYTHEFRCNAPNSRSYNYIFKVLFTTPSWYVFSIGFGHLSMLRWNVPSIHIPMQRNAIQIMCTVYLIKQVAYGAVTLLGSVLQTRPTCTMIGDTYIYNNSLHTVMIRDVAYSLFIRNDWRHPVLFAILRLSICLNSAGAQTSNHAT